jgi:hypothetical protein
MSTYHTYKPDSKWILLSHNETPGRGVTCHRWRWINVDTGEVLETTTDSTMRNWRAKGWANLSEDREPWGAYTGIVPDRSRATTQGVGVATADSRATLQHRLTEAEAEWMRREISKPTNTFGDLFE